MFDRVIFKGHFNQFFPAGALGRFLFSMGILLIHFGEYVKETSAQLKARAQQMAEAAGCPYIYLNEARTHRNGRSKEALAREIAERDGITEGLVCVLATLETANSFGVHKNNATSKLEAFSQLRKCLHFYFYWIDPEFGWMHVRLQSWFPFSIQIYVNGREWLGRQLDKAGIAYERYDNSFTRIDDVDAAQKLGDKFAHKSWPEVLTVFARRCNHMLAVIEQAGFGGYYWVCDQAEIATDIMFKDRPTLERLMPDILHDALTAFSAEDVMNFLGRKLDPRFKGELTGDHKKRPQGRRVKFRMKGNSLKIYDKWSVLRVETTINRPGEFKIFLGEEKGWKPMAKGVSNFWRYFEVGTTANRRFFNALAAVNAQGEVREQLADLCRSQQKNGKTVAKLEPLSDRDRNLFAAVMSGDHLINGFRNHDLERKLYPTPADSPQEKKKRCARLSRLIAKLRGHGLVMKVKNSRLYRVTKHGFQAMAAVMTFFAIEFPKVYAALA
jgi:hypothetical protein